MTTQEGLARAERLRDLFQDYQWAVDTFRAAMAAEEELAAHQAKKEALATEVADLQKRRYSLPAEVAKVDDERARYQDAGAREKQALEDDLDILRQKKAKLETEFGDLKGAFEIFKKEHGLAA